MEAGLDIISGMHARLGIHRRLEGRGRAARPQPDRRQAAAGRHHRRHPAARAAGRRLLTVGTDCALGKKYTALALARAFNARGVGCGFPRHRADRHHDRRRRHADGRGRVRFRRRRRGNALARCGRRSLGRDRRAGLAVPPGLCRRRRWRCCTAASPTSSWSATNPGANVVLGHPAFRLPSIEETIALALHLGRRTNPAIRCAGVSLNTSGMDEARGESPDRLGKRAPRACRSPIRCAAAPMFERLVDSLPGVSTRRRAAGSSASCCRASHSRPS